MMDRREALLLVERLKRRTRDPEVLTLCEYVHGTDVHGTNPGFRRPDVPWTAGCDSIHLVPGVRGTSGGRDGEEKKMAPWAPRLIPSRRGRQRRVGPLVLASAGLSCSRPEASFSQATGWTDEELAAIAAGELATAVPDSGSGDVH